MLNFVNMSETFEFPQYRKYPNDKHFFKIISKVEFEEITMMGSHYSVSRKVASILPDRNLILDMLSGYDGHYITSDQHEYDAILEHCQKHLKKF